MNNFRNKSIKSGARGLTLVELIIAMALSMIVTGAVVSMYVLVLNIRTRLAGEKEVVQRSRIVIEEFDYSISRTDINKAAIDVSGTSGFLDNQNVLTAVAIPRAYKSYGEKFYTVDKNGLPDWKGIRIYYVLPNSSVLRMKDVYPEPMPDLPLSKRKLEAFCDGSGRILAGNLNSLNVEKIFVSGVKDKKGNRVAGGIRIFLKLYYNDRKGLRHIKEVTREFIARNSEYETPGPNHSPLPTPSPPGNAPIVPSD